MKLTQYKKHILPSNTTIQKTSTKTTKKQHNNHTKTSTYNFSTKPYNTPQQQQPHKNTTSLLYSTPFL